jgi:hypothetical protein
MLKLSQRFVESVGKSWHYQYATEASHYPKVRCHKHVARVRRVETSAKNRNVHDNLSLPTTQSNLLIDQQAKH